MFQHSYSVQTISVMWVRPRVLPAPGDLLRREDPGLFAVLLGVAERLWLDFSTLHSGEAENRFLGSKLHALTSGHLQMSESRCWEPGGVILFLKVSKSYIINNK